MQALESALLLAPDDRDIVQQVQRAQRAYNEKSKIQELQSNKNDMPSLLDLEAAACQLAAVKLDSAALLPQSPRAAVGLPGMKPAGKSGGVAAKVSEVSKTLQQMLQSGDEDLLVYFRSCGGLVAAAECLHSAQQLQHGLDDQTVVSRCHQIISGCANVLDAACRVDTNGHVLCGCAYGTSDVQTICDKLTCDEFLRSCCAASGQVETVCVLLHTLSTDSDSRARVAPALFASKDSKSGDSMFIALVKALGSLSGAHQVIAASLLANCVTEKACAKDMTECLKDPDNLQFLTQLLRTSSNAMLLRHASTLLGNASTQPHIRKLLAHDPVSESLAQHVCSFAKSNAQSETPMLACLTCLHNLALEGGSVQLKDALTSQQWQDCIGSLLQQQDTAIVQLVVAITARVATNYKESAAFASTFSCTAVPIATEAAAQAQLLENSEKVAEQGESQAQWSEQSALKMIDATMRLLAACGSAGHMQALDSDGALRLLLWACESTTVMDGCAGNAALCIGFLVDCR